MPAVVFFATARNTTPAGSEEILNKPSSIVVPFPVDRKAIDIGDYRRVDTTLGWRPKVSLREGLLGALEFYREQRAHYW